MLKDGYDTEWKMKPTTRTTKNIFYISLSLSCWWCIFEMVVIVVKIKHNTYTYKYRNNYQQLCIARFSAQAISNIAPKTTRKMSTCQLSSLCIFEKNFFLTVRSSSGLIKSNSLRRVHKFFFLRTCNEYCCGVVA